MAISKDLPVHPPSRKDAPEQLGTTRPFGRPTEALGVTPAADVARIVQEFSSLIQYRIGWRRYFWPPLVLRRTLARHRIVERARAEFATQSARLLNGPSN